MEKYDSEKDTVEHIKSVNYKIDWVMFQLNRRGLMHDDSKLKSPEKETFDEYTPKLKHTTYGSDEYKSYLKEMGFALDHHYKNNRHHPEYFDNGIQDMSLIDIIEMFCDWLSAVERHEDGDIFKSIEYNQDRFGYSDELKNIFRNTAKFYYSTKYERNGE